MRRLLCSLILLAVLVGTGDRGPLPTGEARAEARLVVTQPNGAPRQIELGIRLPTAYFGYGWADRFYPGAGYGGYGIGLGIQMLFPLVPNVGRLLNNTFYLGFFADFLAHPYACGFGCAGNAFSFAFGPQAQWRLFIAELFDSGRFDVFINFGIGLWPWFGHHGYYGFGIFPLVQLGAQLMFTRRIGLGLQFGHPSAQLALQIAF